MFQQYLLFVLFANGIEGDFATIGKYKPQDVSLFQLVCQGSAC